MQSVIQRSERQSRSCKKIPIKNLPGRFIVVDAEDYGRLSRFEWIKLNNRICRYTRSRPKVRSISAEVLQVNIRGRVDHKNLDIFDNRKENLRLSSGSQNQSNRRKPKNNTSGLKGVGKRRDRWEARIVVKGKYIYLGYFDDKIEAAKAYDRAARKYFGEFARPNFPMRFPRTGKHAICNS